MPRLPVTDWFIPTVGGTALVCNSSSCPLPSFTEDNGIKEGDNAIATESNTTESPETKWQKKRLLYNKLDNYPNLLNANPTMANFFNTETPKAIGKFDAIDDNKAQWLNVSPQNVASIAAKVAILNDKLEQMNTAESLLPDEPTNVQLTQLAAQKNTHLNAAAPVAATLLITANAEHIGNVSDANALDVQNNDVLPIAVCDVNEKAVNQVYLNTIAKANSNFTAAEIATLESIAYQCPSVGGTPVFRARSLLTLVGNYEYNLNCSSNGSALIDHDGESVINDRSNNTLSDKAFKLYPNPTKDIVYLNYRTDERALCTMVNTFGQIVNMQTLTPTGNQISIDTQHLPSGVYYIQVKNKARTTIFAQTLVVQH